MVEKREIDTQPAGRPTSLKAAVLGAGADLLQDTTPMRQFDIYVVGFHCGKHEPSRQMEAHHYCHQVNDDFIQYVIMDGNTDDANLIGIEYIVSERLFGQLPEEEKKYWHPHNYEILSGTLVAPGLPDVAEKAFFKLLMNSYGKTFHTWHTGRYDRTDTNAERLPLGEPMLMWSFNRDGEMDPGLLRDRDEQMEIDSEAKRRGRQSLVEVAHPQRGVDDLQGAFPNAAEMPPPGVRDASTATGTPGGA